MITDKDVLLMLGRIDGKLDETKTSIVTMSTRLESMEKSFNAKLAEHDQRLRSLEVSVARTSVISSVLTSAFIAVGIEAAKRLMH